MGLPTVNKLAIKHRELRWAKEAAAVHEANANTELHKAIADWKDVPMSQIKFSNVACFRAPADLRCVYVKSSNPFQNPCVFCGSPEEDVF